MPRSIMIQTVRSFFVLWVLGGFWPAYAAHQHPPAEEDAAESDGVLEAPPAKQPQSQDIRTWIYRWKDAQGNWVISDKPPADGKAEAIELPKPQTYAPPPIDGLARTLDDGGTSDTPADTRMKAPKPHIITPANDSWLDNNVGDAIIRIGLSGPIPDGHELRVYLDGQILGTGQTQFSLNNLPRGTHRIRADIVDLKKKKAVRSTESVFYVRRPFIKK